MLTLRPRILLAAVAALALAAPASAGDSVPVLEAQANPTTVTAGQTTVITPASKADNCVPPRSTGETETAGVDEEGPEGSVFYEVNPAGSFDVIEAGEVPFYGRGQWSISIDTTGYAPGDYEVYVECYIYTDLTAVDINATEGAESAGDGPGPVLTLAAVYNEVPFTVIAPTDDRLRDPTPPPAAQADAVTAAPTFTG
jgi:hypothetical protein